MEQHEPFRYTYSAAQRQEIEQIRNNYLPKEADKMEQLRQLHNSATRKAQVWSLSVGIIGTLVFGTGLSMLLTDPGTLLAAGILIGLTGMVMIALAYPTYNQILKKQRERIAPKILQLTDELLK